MKTGGAVVVSSQSLIPVTVAIPVRNERVGLPACLASIGHRFVDVVVIDSSSTDGTADIAHRHGVRVISFQWNGRFPKKRNWFLRTHPPATPWVLFLDADEFIDDAFCDELARVLPTTSHSGFWLTYDNWFMGRRLRHGTPNRKLALFRVGAGEYERIEEDRWSHLDMEIHEHPILQGTIGEIQARIDHRDDRGLEHWKRRHDAYAAWEAERTIRLDPAALERLTPRQRSKYRSLPHRWLPIAYFADQYIRRLGFLDGRAGFWQAWHKSRYFADIGRRIRAARR